MKAKTKIKLMRTIQGIVTMERFREFFNSVTKSCHSVIITYFRAIKNNSRYIKFELELIY